MGKRIAAVAAIAILLSGSPGRAQPAGWDPQPWLNDLQEMRGAIESKYANLEWLLIERELDLAGLFDRAAAALRQARSDDDARRVFDRVVSRIGDGHVGISWPRANPPGPTPAAAGGAARSQTPADFCRARGFDSSPRGVGPALAGYVPVEAGDVLPAGIVPVGKAKAGVVRIAKFEPGGSPSLCLDAIPALGIALDRPCDQSCHRAVYTYGYQRLTKALEERLTQLRSAGATTLIVDVTGNGGGSEWVQAVGRMLTPRELTSQRLGFARTPHWARAWASTAGKLRELAAAASAQDRPRLLAWAGQAEAARDEANRRCPPTGGTCPWLGSAGFATGLVGKARAADLAGKAWAPLVFSPAHYGYRDGVWNGPLVILVDDGTASAAEELPALLQDNRAALIVGSRTVGSGCGHTWGGDPTRLSHSGATLQLPDCARLRSDGTNEVQGVIPDRLVAWRWSDGGALKAKLLQPVLPEALRRAAALHREGSSRR